MLPVLGWTVGMPAYLLLGVWGRPRTVPLTFRVTAQRWQVLHADDGTALIDVALASIRKLQWAGRSSPTRVELQTDDGVDVVLLIGMARRAADTAATLAPLPSGLLQALQVAGLWAKLSRRPQSEGMVLIR